MTRTAALAALFLLLAASSFAQLSPQYPPAKTATPAATPVAATATTAAPAASETSSLLAQVNQASQATLQDLAGLRIEKWKTDASSKDQLQQQSTSLQRNLAAALPELVAQVRDHPDDVAASFKLYRNLNALYDVLAPLADASGRVGPQSDFDSLARDASAFDSARRAFADRVQAMAAAHDAELVKLREQAKAAAAPPPATKGKVVIDDTKSTRTTKKKKTVPKKTATGKPAAAPQSQ